MCMLMLHPTDRPPDRQHQSFNPESDPPSGCRHQAPKKKGHGGMTLRLQTCWTDDRTNGRTGGLTVGSTVGRTDGQTIGRTDGRTGIRSDHRTDGRTDGRSDRRTDRRTDGGTDGRTDALSHVVDVLMTCNDLLSCADYNPITWYSVPIYVIITCHVRVNYRSVCVDYVLFTCQIHFYYASIEVVTTSHFCAVVRVCVVSVCVLKPV